MNNDNLSIKNELIYFKEDILKDIKSNISKFNSKFESQKETFTNKIEKIELKLDTLFNKFIALSTSFSSNNAISEKVESLERFRSKTQDTLLLYESRFKNQSKLIKEDSYKLDSFINDNIYYNGIIGPTPNCKFSDFHKFIDYIISNISKLNIFKEKTLQLDFKGYKNKIDNIIEIIKLDLENNSTSNNNFTRKAVEECEERIKSLLNIYDEKLMEMRLENNKYNQDLNQNLENILEENAKIKKEIEDLKNIDNKIEVYHNECLEKYENIKKLVEGFETRLNTEKEININNKPNKRKIRSFLKNYIEGKMGVEEIIHHKNNNFTSNNSEEINKNIDNSNINNSGKNKALKFSTPPDTDYWNNEKNDDSYDNNQNYKSKNNDLNNAKINLFNSDSKNNFYNNNIQKISEYASKYNKKENDNNKKIIESNSEIIKNENLLKRREKEFKYLKNKNKYLSIERDSIRNSAKILRNQSLEFDKNSINNNENKMIFNKINLNQNDIKKIIIHSLISGKNSFTKLSLINNSDYHNPLNLDNITINVDKNINKENKSNHSNKDILDNNVKKFDNKLLNIVNYSDIQNNKNQLKKKNKNYLLSEQKSDNSNTNIEHINIDKKIIHKKSREKSAFRNKLEKKSFLNKNEKSNLALFESFNNKNKMEIIAINQIEKSLKYIRNDNNKTNLHSVTDRIKSNIFSSASNPNFDNSKSNKKIKC